MLNKADTVREDLINQAFRQFIAFIKCSQTIFANEGKQRYRQL